MTSTYLVKKPERENFVKNPIAHVNTTGITASSSAGMTEVALSRVACAWSYGVEFCYQATGKQPNDSTNRQLRLTVAPTGTGGAPCAAGELWTASAHVKTVNPSDSLGYRWTVIWSNSKGETLRTDISGQTVDEGAEDIVVSYSPPAAPANAAFVSARLEQVTTTPNDVLTFQATRLLLERSATLKDAFPTLKQLSSGTVKWVGTAHSSYSIYGPGAVVTRYVKVGSKLKAVL